MKHPSACNGVVRLALLGLAVVVASGVHANVLFTVNTIADQIDDDTSDGLCHTSANQCSLRAAVMQANQTTGAGATIVLPSGIYTLSRPATAADGDDNGDLNLTTPAPLGPVITIIGAGASTTIIDGNTIDRVLSVDMARTAAISGVTIRNGLRMGANAGGVSNKGTLTITDSGMAGFRAVSCL